MIKPEVTPADIEAVARWLHKIRNGLAMRPWDRISEACKAPARSMAKKLLTVPPEPLVRHIRGEA